MFKPTWKAPEIEGILEAITGKDRCTTIQRGKCTTCDTEQVGPFRDPLSEKEYTISGMCQKCQDEVFGPGTT